jgi:hypothetical protein
VVNFGVKFSLALDRLRNSLEGVAHSASGYVSIRHIMSSEAVAKGLEHGETGRG